MATTYIKGAEGFDIYPLGAIANKYPWIVSGSHNSITGNGVFGGQSLQLGPASSNAVSLQRLFPSSIVLRTNNAGYGMFGVSFWISGTPDLTTSQLPILSIGNTSGNYQLLQWSYDSSSGTSSLVFPTNFSDITKNPTMLPVTAGHNYWVSVMFAFGPSGRIVANYYVNGYYRRRNFSLSWPTDLISSGALDRITLYETKNTITLDDLIIQAVSSLDSNWPLASGVNPSADDLGLLTARRIYVGNSAANGSVIQWESSNASVPNYQAATNGVDHVTADNTVLATDLYKFAVPEVTGVTAVVYKGVSTRPNVGAVQKVGSNISDLGVRAAGDNSFIGITESDGTNPWTSASIAAAEFGMKEI